MPINVPFFRLSADKTALFHSYVDSSGGPESCWPWIRGRDAKGYGRFKVEFGITSRAHRLAYFLAHGVDPGDLMVCHSCDNPPCCNPAHLWLGDNRANQMDCDAKGRRAPKPNKGQENGNAKLSAADVDRIRVMIAGGSTNKAIGRVFGVTHQAISRIRRGRSWGAEPMQAKYQSLRRG